jgi:hypothetical protein
MPQLDLSEAYDEHGPLPMEVVWPEDVSGLQAVYRVGFTSMDLPRVPRRVQIGNVVILRVMGPVASRSTTVVQRSHAPLVWDKTSASVTVGGNVPLTVCHVAAFLPTAQELQATFQRWKDEAYAAVGVLASLLDDRVARSEILDDFLVYEGSTWVGIADHVGNVRNYLPFRISPTDEATISGLAGAEMPPNAMTAARWYVRAAQVGPTADGIPYLWTSLEALTGAEGRQVVRTVEDALRDVGEDPEQLEPRLGRLWGERAQIVRLGQTEPSELLVNGWYVLERVTRTLLRNIVGAETTWPAAPGKLDALPADVRELWTATPARTEWHEANG